MQGSPGLPTPQLVGVLPQTSVEILLDLAVLKSRHSSLVTSDRPHLNPVQLWEMVLGDRGRRMWSGTHGSTVEVVISKLETK